MKKMNRKGFTLIELLVVIAIIAVLAVVVILSLNPAELLRQARDSNRVSDMATMKSALSLYLADVASPNLASSSLTCGTNTGYLCVYISSGNSGFNLGGVASSGIGTLSNTTTLATTTRGVGATNGWVPVNFSAISSGAPIGNLPVDPVNASSSAASIGGGALVYGYVATSSPLGFKLVAHTESTKYSTGGGGGASDVETGDGGLSTSTLESGTNLAL